MQCQRVPSPRNVLPATEVPQEFGAARLPHQGEIIEPMFLETASESTAILYLSRDEQAPGGRHVARKIHVAFLGIVEPGREHVDRPASSLFVKNPQLAPALERLHSEHQRRTSRDGLYRSHPHNPVG